LSCSIREATRTDIEFLREMLCEAAYWRSGTERPPNEDALSRPELARILRDWGRDGDTAVLALGPEGESIGAAWYRFWTEEDHSYGYVGPDVPELGMAVAATHRGEGVGGELLGALLKLAAGKGVHRVSLSVERDNRAFHLYKRYGFTTVGAQGNSWTMVVEIAGSREAWPPR
jgi:ribosomal-protein-alanine N-acetyltransferase